MTERVISGWANAERRRARRFKVNWDAVVKGKDEVGSILQESGSLRNLSSRGALLTITKQLKVGMRLELWIQVPSDLERWMAYSAQIVRIDQSGIEFDTAAKFLSARPRLHSRLSEAAEQELEILQIQ